MARKRTKFGEGELVEIVGNKDYFHCHEVGEIGLVVRNEYPWSSSYCTVKVKDLTQTVPVHDLAPVEVTKIDWFEVNYA